MSYGDAEYAKHVKRDQERTIDKLCEERDALKAENQHLWTEIERLRAALTASRAAFAYETRITSHWDGCEKVHPTCAIIKHIDSALRS